MKNNNTSAGTNPSFSIAAPKTTIDSVINASGRHPHVPCTGSPERMPRSMMQNPNKHRMPPSTAGKEPGKEILVVAQPGLHASTGIVDNAVHCLELYGLGGKGVNRENFFDHGLIGNRRAPASEIP